MSPILPDGGNRSLLPVVHITISRSPDSARVLFAPSLHEGRLAGAGLDVFTAEPLGESPLLALDNVVLTPRIGGQTVEGLLRMGQMTVENCLRALRAEEPLYTV